VIVATLVTVAVSVALTDDLRRQRAQMLRSASVRAYGSMKGAAVEAERDQAQFNRQVDALEGSMGTFYRQSDEWWSWLAVSILETVGLPQGLERAADVRKRMAKASLSAEQKESVA
jgi:hypothetical protein